MAISSILRDMLDLLRFLIHNYERWATICAAAAIVAGLCYWLTRSPKPVSVNYFFSRKCNKECGFCFHTAKTSYVLPQQEAHRGLWLLREAGMQKLNIAGGEPFLYPKFLAAMMKFCKEELHLESVSIVTNGSKVTRDFLRQNGKYIDVLAVSCDSFDQKVNDEIGRGGPHDDNAGKLFKIRDWCREFNIKFKLNTVVCRLNFNEDMVAKVEELAPSRWKVFQVLMVQGENDSDETLRNMNRFRITDDEFEVFCNKHRHVKNFIPEDNSVMASSYLLVDEYMRFMDKGNGPMKLSDTILDVGVTKALSQVRWDYAAFQKRGGIYQWSKSAVVSRNTVMTEGAAIAQEMGAGATTTSGCGAGKQLPEW